MPTSELKLALTENKPTIKPYNEPPGPSWPIQRPDRSFADAPGFVHTRWDRLWRSLKPEHFARVLIHPEHGERTVDWLLFIYEWHGKHHTAHVTELRKKKGW